MADISEASIRARVVGTIPTYFFQPLVGHHAHMKVTDVLTTLRKRETMPTMTDELPPMTSPLDPDDFDKPASRGFVRYELAVTRGELREEIAATKLELKQDIANVRAELKQDIADLRLELADVRRELKQDIADLRNEMMERFNKLDRSLWWKLSVAVAAASALSELLSRM
jgi:hypothetical protein